MGCENKNAFYETATNPMVCLCKFETPEAFSIRKASFRENKMSNIFDGRREDGRTIIALL